jgi:hypothetical protein
MQEIIEIYNLKIHNYPKSTKDDIQFKDGIQFGNLEKSPIGMDGTVRVYNTDKVKFDSNDQQLTNNHLLLTKDPLNSPHHLKNKYYKLYKNEFAKKDRSNQVYKFDLDTFKKLLNSTICIYKKNLINYKPSINIDKEIDMMKADNEGYIRKINITNKDKIIICGDFHGSFHTFFRTILRLHIYGVLNIETYTINDNYKLIFLGDIIDRGEYSLEIFEILFKFIHNDKNNDKIIINRGNHETADTARMEAFFSEIAKIINSYSEKRDFFNNMIYFFRLCPSAIILHNINTNTNYWLCHGYIPHNNNIDCKIIDLINHNDDILRISNIQEIMWNDPAFETNIFKTAINYPRDTRGDKGIYLIGLERLHEFRVNTNIHFIVRGHNDNYANACLLSNRNTLSSNLDTTQQNSKFFELGNKSVYIENQNFLNTNLSNKLSLPNQYIDGSVENIFMNGDWTIDTEKYPCQNFKVYPILTISTNTDQGRSLTCDSFIVLHTTINSRDRNESILKITPIDINDYLNTDDSDSLINIIIEKPFLLEQSNQKNNQDFLLKAIFLNPIVLKYSDLKNDEKFLLKALIINRKIIQFVDPSLRNKLEEQFKNKYIKYKLKYLKLSRFYLL